MDFTQYWDKINENKQELSSLYSSYWNKYSDLSTWLFWVELALLVVPLLLLFFVVDRKKLFEVLFFGYTVHMIWSYTQIALGRSTLFYHNYFLLPILPNASNVTASLLPVGYLLLYQYCSNRHKNFLIFAPLLSAVFTFGFASIEKYLGLISFQNRMNQFWLFLIGIVIAYISYRITKFFQIIQN
ncbi:hypothetical protein [Neobacillus vireti]|uniref:hypothetical protein n=1 Tax=Neobacillus vireti TaxID=220686 RepID=UPI002FFD986C